MSIVNINISEIEEKVYKQDVELQAAIISSYIPTPTIIINNDKTIELYGYPKTIADGQFQFSNASTIQIGNQVTLIGDNAFQLAAVAGSIVFPDSVNTIGDQSFSSNGNITKVVFGNGVISIGNGAFYMCGLSEVVFGSSVQHIGVECFADQSASSLSNIVLPESLLTIGEMAFYRAGLIGSIIIPHSVSDIGDSAFEWNSLSGLNLGSVNSIGVMAFRNAGLTSVTIPSSVSFIGALAFDANNITNVNAYIPKTIIDNNSPIFDSVYSDVMIIHARASDNTWTAGTNLTISGKSNVTVIKDL